MATGTRGLSHRRNWEKNEQVQGKHDSGSWDGILLSVPRLVVTLSWYQEFESRRAVLLLTSSVDALDSLPSTYTVNPESNEALNRSRGTSLYSDVCVSEQTAASAATRCLRIPWRYSVSRNPSQSSVGGTAESCSAVGLLCESLVTSFEGWSN
jgi:hypothetical protein